MTLAPDVEVTDRETVLLEPRVIAKTYMNSSWPQPQFLQVVDGKVCLQNDTGEIIALHKKDHICQIFKTTSVDVDTISELTPKSKTVVTSGPFSKEVIVDPDKQLSDHERR